MKYYVIVFLFFSIYSFLGWVLETTSVSLEKGRFVNRGFLTGCFCPVYGFGAVIVIKVSSWLNIYVRNEFSFIIVDILVSIVLITALEYSTGIILNNIFNRKWWDYSNEFANINGYVCLRNSIIWGILAVLLVQFIHPIIYKVVLYAPNKVNNIFTMVIILYLIIDTLKSVIHTLGLEMENRSKIKIGNSKLAKMKMVLKSRL